MYMRIYVYSCIGTYTYLHQQVIETKTDSFRLILSAYVGIIYLSINLPSNFPILSLKMYLDTQCLDTTREYFYVDTAKLCGWNLC